MSVQQLIKFEIFISTNIIYLKALFESLSISLLSSQHTLCVHMITVQPNGKSNILFLKGGPQDFPCLLSSDRAWLWLRRLKCIDDELFWLFWDTTVVFTNLQRSCSSLQLGPSSIRHAIHKLGNCWRLVADWGVADWGTRGVRYYPLHL
jgi:hypothetical protein